MSGIDTAAAARARIEPLTGYTPGPWAVDMSYQWPSKVRAAPPFNDRWICDASSKLPHTLSNARLIAAAPDLRDMVAILADAVEAEQAKVAAAYEAAAYRARVHREPSLGGMYWDGVNKASRIIEDSIRALTPAAAEAALDKMLAEARLEGWRAGRDAAAEIVDGTARYHMGDPDDIEVVRLTAAEIRALPEPKETSHD